MFKLISLLLFVSFFASAQTISSTFPTNNDGWQYDQGVSTAATAITWNSTGGNPGGDVSFNTTAPQANYYALAPLKFNGDQSSAYDRTLTFDLQQSTAGSDNIFADVILTNAVAGISLYYTFPTKPSVGSWSSYSVPLNESSWKYGCITCSAATQIQMKQVLSNVTALHIRMKYIAAAGAYTSLLDNVVLNYGVEGPAPTITAFTPQWALPGATFQITGTNFNPTPGLNAVYFNGVKATPTTASATQLTINYPGGAAPGPVTVVNLATHQQATSTQIFSPYFNNNFDQGGRIIPSSMSIGNKIFIPATTDDNRFGNMEKGDLDGDGLIDLIAAETNATTIDIFRNTGAGTLTPTSFNKFVLPTIKSVLGNGSSLAEVIIRDLDSDGKLDIAVTCAGGGAGQAYFGTFRNISTPGNLAFEAPEFFAYDYYSGGISASGDLDGDGRVDLVASTGSSPGNLWVCRNLSSVGDIDFAFSIPLGSNSGFNDLEIKDLNADGKAEIIASGYNAAAFTIFKNNSTPGNLSFTNFNVATTRGAAFFTIADLDNDSHPDLAWSGYSYDKLYIFRNGYTGSTFDATTFGSEIAITNTLLSPTGVAYGDMNGDGIMDLVATGISDMAIFQNNNLTPGSISPSSFNKSVVYEGAFNGESIYATPPVVADLDGDNKPEVAMMFTNNGVNTLNKGIFIFHNECFPVPVITSLSDYHAGYNADVDVTGDHFNTYGDVPQVRVEGMITGSSDLTNTDFTTTAKVGETNYRMGVTLHGLSAYSPLPFFASFNSSKTIDASSFGTSVDYTLAYSNPYEGLVVADLNDDGKPDIVTTDVVSGFSVSKVFQSTATQNSDVTTSTFTQLLINLGAILHVKPDDIDGDGKIDLVANGSIFRNTSPSPAMAFQPATSMNAGGVTRFSTQHDLNRDGKTDILTTNGTQVVIYENQSRSGAFTSSGTFPTISGTIIPINSGGSLTGITAGDFDGDGWEDIAFGVAAASGNLSVLKNLGTTSNISTAQFATAVTFPASSNPAHIITADFDGDNKLDIAIGNNASTFVSIYRNTSSAGSISFARTDVTTLTGAVGIDVSDIDGDKKTDIVVIHQAGSTGNFSILKNNSTSGNISFANHVDFSLPGVPVSLAIADVNLDTLPDIIIVRGSTPTTTTGALSIFQNKIQASHLSITTEPMPTLNVCKGGTPTLTVVASGASDITYQWQVLDGADNTYKNLNNDNTYSNVGTASMTINTANSSGTHKYIVVVGGDGATIQSDVSTITIAPTPAAPTVGDDITHCGPGSFTLAARGATTGENYLWYDDNGEINGQTLDSYTTPTISATTSYSVALTDGACVSEKKEISITINTCDPTNPTNPGAFGVYGAVSPNGDTKNDFLLLKNIESLTDYQQNEVHIFNRWGDEVYSATDYNNTTTKFDGSGKDGKLLPAGTYFYKITFASGKPTLTGVVDLRY